MTTKRFNRHPFNANPFDRITKALQYVIVNSVSSIRRFNRTRFNRPIEEVSHIQKWLTYYIQSTVVGLTKSMEYGIRQSPILTSKSIQYYIKATAAVSKGLQYTVFVSTELSKSLQYAIRGYILIHEPAIWKQTVTVATPSGSPNYPCQVIIPYDSRMVSTFADIRFGNDDTGEMYAATRSTYIAASSATFVVEIPDANQSTFTLYFGNIYLVVQEDYNDPGGSVVGTPNGIVNENKTFLYRYLLGDIA